MKVTSYILIGVGTVLSLAACKRELISDTGNYSKVYIPQAVDYPAERTFIMADTLQSIRFGAAFGGVDDQTQTLTVKFKADPSLVESFNQKNGTNYLAMPAGSYELVESEAVIPTGQLHTGPITIKVKTVGGIAPLKSYLLPVTIEQISPSVTINEDLRTAYFLVKGSYADFARTNWSVVSASSFESTNPPALVLDNLATTWWFTQWRTAQPGPPHNIVIDMGEEKNVHGLYILPLNQATGNPQNIHIDVSMDKTAWLAAGDYVLANNPTRQDIYFNTLVRGRYFRVVINSSYGGKHFTYITEIGAF